MVSISLTAWGPLTPKHQEKLQREVPCPRLELPRSPKPWLSGYLLVSRGNETFRGFCSAIRGLISGLLFIEDNNIGHP